MLFGLAPLDCGAASVVVVVVVVVAVAVIALGR